MSKDDKRRCFKTELLRLKLENQRLRLQIEGNQRETNELRLQLVEALNANAFGTKKRPKIDEGNCAKSIRGIGEILTNSAADSTVTDAAGIYHKGFQWAPSKNLQFWRFVKTRRFFERGMRGGTKSDQSARRRVTFEYQYASLSISSFSKRLVPGESSTSHLFWRVLIILSIILLFYGGFGHTANRINWRLKGRFLFTPKKPKKSFHIGLQSVKH